LQPDLGPPGGAKPRGRGQRRRSPDPIAKLPRQRRDEPRIVEGGACSRFEILEGRHERLRNEASAKRAESPPAVGHHVDHRATSKACAARPAAISEAAAPRGSAARIKAVPTSA